MGRYLALKCQALCLCPCGADQTPPCRSPGGAGLTVEAKKRVDAYGEAGQLLNFCPGAAATRTGDPLQVYPEAVGRMEILDGMLHPERKNRLPILP